MRGFPTWSIPNSAILAEIQRYSLLKFRWTTRAHEYCRTSGRHPISKFSAGSPESQVLEGRFRFLIFVFCCQSQVPVEGFFFHVCNPTTNLQCTIWYGWSRVEPTYIPLSSPLTDSICHIISWWCLSYVPKRDHWETSTCTCGRLLRPSSAKHQKHFVYRAYVHAWPFHIIHNIFISNHIHYMFHGVLLLLLLRTCALLLLPSRHFRVCHRNC